MKEYQIQNDKLTLLVSSYGAEMRSLKERESGKEYLWQADPAFWGRTSPILFPLVGNYKEKRTKYEGKWYKLPQHGFARDMEFSLISQTEEELWMELRETQETLAAFPFQFRLSLGYRLAGRSVKVLWKVENTGSVPMYFSIGGHPAFLCPIDPEEKQTECRFLFDTEKDLAIRTLDENGLVKKESVTVSTENGQLPITDGMFDGDAWIIEDGQAHKVSLLDGDGRPYVEVSFETPLVGLWSPAGKHAPFVCIEPWCGRADGVGFSQELTERKWGNILEPGGRFENGYEIHICERLR